MKHAPWVSFVAGLAVVSLAAPAAAEQASVPLLKQVEVKSAPALKSRSKAYPWDGTLVAGLRLRQSRHLRYVSEYRSAGHFYGIPEMVRMIERAARAVARRYPGSKLSVGELSARRGGDIDGHRSHESGRDADIAFFAKRPDGRLHEWDTFVPFDAQGRGLAANQPLRFDDARNWLFVAQLLTDPQARIQYIFVAKPIRARLLREAVRRRAPAALIARAESVLVQPAKGNPHRSHFHVRVYCPPSDRPGCLDVAPFWAWYPEPDANPRHAREAQAGGPDRNAIASATRSKQASNSRVPSD